MGHAAIDRSDRRAIPAAFLGLTLAVGVGLFLPRALFPGMSDAARLAVYLVVPLGIVAGALRLTHGLALRDLPGEVGLDRSALGGIAWAFLLTSPILLGFLLLREGVFFEEDGLVVMRERPLAVLRGWAGAGLVEETIFRGYFFAQLVRRGGWPVGRAILVTGVLFGLLHVPAAWGKPTAEVIGAAVVTGAGGAGLCWFFARWNWNLGFVIGWHAFVNLFWTLGQAGDAVGSSSAGALRLGVIVLTVVVTLRRFPVPEPNAPSR